LIIDNYYQIERKEISSLQDLEQNRLEIIKFIEGK